MTRAKRRALYGSITFGLIALLCAGALLLLPPHNRDEGIRQLTEIPATANSPTMALAQARQGTFALRARVRFDDIEALATEQLPDNYPVTGTKRVCKRLLGIEACGTANWNLLIHRPGELQVHGDQGVIFLSSPLRFAGNVGVEGRVARVLGMNSMVVSGEARTVIALSLQMGENWCPAIRADVSYEWTETPTMVSQSGLDFNLESVVNDALDKQLATLEPRLNDAIDCAAFAVQLSRYWRSYSFPIDIPMAQADPQEEAQTEQLHINIQPSDFAFSGLRTDKDSLGVSFALGATTVVDTQPLAIQDLALPPLRQVTFAQSRTDFDLVLRSTYSQLETLITPRLVNRSYSTDSAAGLVSVTLSSFEITGNAQDVTVALGFMASLPGSRKPVNGLVYLQASPVIDADKEQLLLENIRLSRVLDSTLWKLLSRVFEGQIIAALEKNAVLDLAPYLRALEANLSAQLQDPKRTAGVNVHATDLSIRIMEIVAEPTTLAARARVVTDLDVDIPLTVIQKPLQ